MPLNTNIPLGVQGVNIADPLAKYGQIAAIQGAQNQNALAKYQLSAAQRAEEQAQGLNEAYKNALDPTTGQINQNALMQGLIGKNLGSQIPAVTKTLTEGLKAQTEAEAAKLKLGTDRQNALGKGLLSIINNPSDESVHSAFATLKSLGVPVDEHYKSILAMPPVDRSAAAKMYALQTEEGQKAVAAVSPKVEKVQTSSGKIVFMDMNPNSKTYGQEVMPSIAADMTLYERGQLGVAQENAATNAKRLALEKQKLDWEKQNPGYELKQDDDGNYVAINKKTLQAKPVIGANGQPLSGNSSFTEGQTNAATFGARMGNSSKIINSIESSGLPNLTQRTAAAFGVTRGLAGEAAQQYDQAKMDWITANLRKESGATIGDDEFAREEKKYFPQPNDSPSVIEQKRKSRAIAEQGMMSAAGGAGKALKKQLESQRKKDEESSNSEPNKPNSENANITRSGW